MNVLDIRTIFISYMISNAVCAIVILSLWLRSRERSPEMGFWLADYIMQFFGLALISLRGSAPDFLSITVANILIIGGTVLLLVGLERYVGRRSVWLHNALMLAVFAGVHAYFTYVQPSLTFRNICVSAALLFLTLQGVWLMMRRVDRAMRGATRAVGIVFLAYTIVGLFRIAADASGPRVHELFLSGPVDAGVVLAQQMLFIGLTFALVLMVNRRLFAELQRDIRERMLAEEALRLSEQKFALAFQNIPDAITLTSARDGRVIEVNESFYRLTGFSKSEVAGATTLGLNVWADVAERDAFVAELEKHRRVLNVEAQFRKKSGEVFPGVISGEVIEIQGEPCVLSIIHDATASARAREEILRLNADLEDRVQERTEQLESMNEELTKANEELIDSNVRLETATRAKSDFLASMSHELRTPLNSIIGFSGILSRGMVGDLEPEQLTQVRMINTAGKNLLELVNDVLDLSAIEAGHVRLQLKAVDVLAVVGHVAHSMLPQAAEKGLALSWDASSDAVTLVSDRKRLEQVLLNLVGNAIKFTVAGEVQLYADRDGDDVVFTVTDSGIGIAEVDQLKVFDDFYQADRVDIAKSEGTGLGLAVSRRLLDMLGGTISFESTPGVGSIFTVRVPVGGPPTS